MDKDDAVELLERAAHAIWELGTDWEVYERVAKGNDVVAAFCLGAQVGLKQAGRWLRGEGDTIHPPGASDEGNDDD